MRITWLEKGSGGSIALPLSLVAARPVPPRRVVLTLGSWRREFAVEYPAGWPPETVGLPAYLGGLFTLPEDLPYQAVVSGRTLSLGPVIAVAAAGSACRLTPERLAALQVYLAEYPAIGGLIYVCAADGVDVATQTIAGYYYRPEGGGSWQAGRFPYPGAMYRQTEFANAVYNSLTNVMGERLFNSYFFNKWEMWQWLSPEPVLKRHLPQTARLTGWQDVAALLAEHEAVYLKQIDGRQAKGLLRVARTPAGWRMADNSGLVVEGNTAPERVSALAGSGRYLVQQAVAAARYQDRPVDFRVIMQKDGHKRWQCTAVIARFGAEEAIATNFVRAGFAKPGTEALRLVFGLTESQAFTAQAGMIALCRLACETIDNCGGLYGDLGIDVVLDTGLKPWLLEINKLHDHRMPLYGLKDRGLYQAVVAAPLRFAAALAGFQAVFCGR